MQKRPYERSVLVALLIGCQLVGVLGAFLFPTGDTEWYRSLSKPAFQPPGWVFGPVWTLLYALMAISAWRVWRTPDGAVRRRGLRLFALQLVLNGIWTPVFFGAHEILAALVILLALVCALGATLWVFRKVDRLAAWLLVPYLAWVGFASVLNAAIYSLN